MGNKKNKIISQQDVKIDTLNKRITALEHNIDKILGKLELYEFKNTNKSGIKVLKNTIMYIKNGELVARHFDFGFYDAKLVKDNIIEFSLLNGKTKKYYKFDVDNEIFIDITDTKELGDVLNNKPLDEQVNDLKSKIKTISDVIEPLVEDHLNELVDNCQIELKNALKGIADVVKKRDKKEK